MSPGLMERAQFHYGPLGIITGIAKVRFWYPPDDCFPDHWSEQQRRAHQKRAYGIVGRTIIKGKAAML